MGRWSHRPHLCKHLKCGLLISRVLLCGPRCIEFSLARKNHAPREATNSLRASPYSAIRIPRSAFPIPLPPRRNTLEHLANRFLDFSLIAPRIPDGSGGRPAPD